jgi:Zn-dependent protease with chaperone function
MTNLPIFRQEPSIAGQTTPEELQPTVVGDWKQTTFKKLRGGFFLVLGYLLSPLCWWNDLLFNLPIAYGFGYICSLFYPKLLLPCSIIGYWLSNIIGILLMQFGAMDVLQNQPKERNLKKELLSGVVTSTIYTLVILALVQLKIIDAPVPLLGS